MNRLSVPSARALAVTLAAVGLLGACGGGGGGSGDPLATLTGSYLDGLARLGTRAGLTSTTFLEAFAASYRDAGLDKAGVAAALTAEAAALDANAAHSLFPQATLTNVSLRGCDGGATCTLVGTLTNADADSTTVDVSIPVQYVNGTLQVVGDQLAS